MAKWGPMSSTRLQREHRAARRARNGMRRAQLFLHQVYAAHRVTPFIEGIHAEDLGPLGDGGYKHYRHYFVLHERGTMTMHWFEFAYCPATGERIALGASSDDVWTLSRRLTPSMV
jgi:hypothetical protein